MHSRFQILGRLLASQTKQAHARATNRGHFSFAHGAGATADLLTPTSFPATTSSNARFIAQGEPVRFESNNVMPQLRDSTDAIIRVLKTTICGTDIQILSGDVDSCKPGTGLGHEGIGEIVAIGDDVTGRRVGDRVLATTTTSCGNCTNCLNQFYSHCETGGWQLGNLIDGLQATHARIPHADYSTKIIPRHIWDTELEDDIVLCSDIMPAGLEVGLLDGDIKPGMRIAIVGAGPTGLAAMMCASMYSPRELHIIDINPHRLEASQMCASATPGLVDTPLHLYQNSEETAAEQVMRTTGGEGVDLVVEAIGLPVGWYISQEIVKPGGHIAILGVHIKPVTINLERMWYRNFRFSAGLVHGYTTDMLMERVIAGQLPARMLISHRMPLSDIEHAYHMFQNAEEHKTLKILLENDM